MTVFVLMNTIVLAMDYYGISNEMEEVLSNINLVFTIIFIIELAIKLAGLGFK